MDTSAEAMDLYFSALGESESAAIEDEDETDDPAFENERCGICADVVIDRGVLDCCQHWFCFTCIDNWSTITTLCPICKNEFQLITCLPVYDTIGSIKEEHLFSRDEDWSIQGKNNTLSFPSYYIDEDAVVCLDGDGCKIRSGLLSAEEELTLDTSIACDSCDIWYHAFCVGFNPECTTSESSWLCPRCITDEAQQSLNKVQMQYLGKSSAVSGAYPGWTDNPSFSGKVSVSVADDGETAVVVSMVEGQQKSEPRKTSATEVENDFNEYMESESFLPDPNPGHAKIDVKLESSGLPEVMCNSLVSSNLKGFKASSPEKVKNPENFMDMSPVRDCMPSVVVFSEESSLFPFLEDAAPKLNISRLEKDKLLCSKAPSESEGASCYSVTHVDLKATSAEQTTTHPCNLNGLKLFSPSHNTSETTNATSEDKFRADLHIGSSVTSSSVDELVCNHIKTQMPGASEERPTESSSSDELTINCYKGIINNQQQRNDKMGKHGEEMQPHVNDVTCLKSQTTKREMETKHPTKKAKSGIQSLRLPPRSQVNDSSPDNLKSDSRSASDNDDDNLTYARTMETKSPDIMSIVKEMHRSHDDPAGSKAMDKFIDKKDNATGLRVKKIMRRVGEEKHSSVLIQKLGKEIREAVQDKTRNNTGNHNDFDVKLLTAFRAAIVKPKEVLNSKIGPSRVGLKKSHLQKGKIRENLTKKIYATLSGKRKRAWDRDCQIEFWKHHCQRSKPEKAETLHSVLELLKKATNTNSLMDDGHDGETTNSILSRVYLADTSVFPRKDDIKPLSALSGSPQTVNESSIGKSSTGITKRLEQANVVSSDNTAKKSGNSSLKHASCREENLDGMITESAPISESSSSKGRVQNQKEPASRSDSAKIDKRKWALEVLARKNASGNSNASKEDDEDKKDTLKRNYPLLAQLPADMRPVLASSRHKKVPLSVRQVQLYRITEHYLRRTNLTHMRRTAETELAVADAVNIEKDMFERSNSKLVYINLCSHALSQCSNKPRLDETIASSSTIAEVADLTEEASSYPTAGRWSNVEEALKLAGLASDSPPNSPCRLSPVANEKYDPRGNTRDQDLENVLDMDSHPELDIYGDFEYDLEDEGYVGLSTLPQQQSGDSKLKVVLSTLKCEELVNLESRNSENEAPSDELNKHKGDTAIVMEEIKTDTVLVPKTSEGEIYKEPSLAENEELYGPEDLPTKKICNEVVEEMNRPMKVLEVVEKSTIPCESEKCDQRSRATDSKVEGSAENSCVDGKASLNHEYCGSENSPAHSLMSKSYPKERTVKLANSKSPDPSTSISKKVEAYIKEHIRPLCKSGVITVEQYRWAVGKTTAKVMKHHHKAKNANFLIKEGEKVKKLAEQYIETAQKNER